MQLARKIRTKRIRSIGPDLRLADSLTLSSALNAVIERNGFENPEARKMKRCFMLAWKAIRPSDRKECGIRRVRESRFISVNANNHLAIRVPAWDDYRARLDGDILLIWPKGKPPSLFSPSRARREMAGRFVQVPCTNIMLSWDECLALSRADWRLFAEGVHIGLTGARTRKWTSNVTIA